MTAKIIGVGSYLPERVLTNQDLEEMVDTSDDWIRTRTGILERRIIEADENVSDLAAKASLNAISDAGLKVSDIDLIILSTCSPEMILPSTACLVQHKIGAKTTPAFDVMAGCTGFIYALSVAAQFIETGTYRNILVIGADALSRHIDWQDRNTCVLFGDGAGAVVLGPDLNGFGILANYLASTGAGAGLLSIPGGASAAPAHADSFDKTENYLQMNGSEVFKFATRALPRAVKDVTRRANVDLSGIDYIIPHQANYRIIETAARKLNVDSDRIINNIERLGNTSTASIPIALDELYRSGRLKRGDLMILVGFGAGLTWGANLIKWADH
ncbi:MAG: beta-ketoacyl-ACP synthase III [Actinomycetota bacterium]|nr:beta-ketoacyl-ACP synthase III [Actinomycetota bacterium]